MCSDNKTTSVSVKNGRVFLSLGEERPSGHAIRLGYRVIFYHVTKDDKQKACTGKPVGSFVDSSFNALLIGWLMAELCSAGCTQTSRRGTRPPDCAQ